MLPTVEELQQMRKIDIMMLDREQLADVEDIVIDTEKSMENRVKSFMEQTKNPFAFKIGEYILQVDFADDAMESIDDRLLLLAKKKMQIMV